MRREGFQILWTHNEERRFPVSVLEPRTRQTVTKEERGA